MQDLECEWNRPRYMTTALWGSAWSAPGVPLKKLCNALQDLPEEFWKRGAAISSLLTGGSAVRFHLTTTTVRSIGWAWCFVGSLSLAI